ncbi:MAG: hypothetical protein O8C56_06255 [Candidatus Methanoperedens sp.]|nr:hypothetical protein [Candidatus Methanoperedens sp.]
MARKKKLKRRPIQGLSAFVARAWLMSDQDFAVGIHPSRNMPRYEGSERMNIASPIHTAHQSSFFHSDDQSISAILCLLNYAHGSSWIKRNTYI